MVLAPILVAIAAAPQAVEQSIDASRAAIALNFESATHARFRAWGARSNLALSTDGTGIYFTENGPDGVVLKKSDLKDGSVQVIGHPGAVYYSIAAIPNDPDHILLAQKPGDGTPARALAVFEVSTGAETLLDLGKGGGAGDLLVSPSGRFVATRINFTCHSGGRDCIAEDLAILSLKTGQIEFSMPWPVIARTAEEQGVEGGVPVKTLRVTPLSVQVAWTDDDRLSLRPSPGTTSLSPKLVTRGAAAQWTEKETSGESTTALVLPPGGGEKTLSPRRGENKLSLPTDQRGGQVTVDAEALFELSPARIEVQWAKEKVVVVKAGPSQDRGWESVDVVVLKQKAIPAMN